MVAFYGNFAIGRGPGTGYP